MTYPVKDAKYAGEDRAAKLCRADGGSVDDTMRAQGKAKLQRAFQDRALEDAMLMGQSPRMRAGEEASREAYQRGDYKPNVRGGSNYKPWNPKRGED